MVRAVVFVAMLSGVAAASPVRLELASDHCDLAPVRAAVAALAGDDPFDDAADRAIRIDGTQLTDAPIARIWFDDGHGHVRGPRVVQAASCAELVDAVALVVTLALPHDPPPRQEPDPSPVDVDEPEATTPPRRATTSTHVLLGVAVTARDAHEQAYLGARWRRGAGSISLTARYDAGEALAVSTMGRVDVSRTDVALSPCLHAGAFAGCIVAGIGVIEGAGEHLMDARSVASPAAFTGLAFEWQHPLGAWLALRAHVQGDALLTTTELDVDNMPVWKSSRLEAAAGLGFLVHLP